MSKPISSHHFIMIPLMAQGHMIPLFDLARLLSERGVKTTIYTTPLNVARFSPTVARNRDLDLPVHLVEIPFPWKEVGLPEGCENLDALPSPDLLRNFHCALEKMKEPIERHMEEQTPPPSCIISDRTFFWTLELSRKFGIPRFLFNGMGCFARLAIHNVEHYFPDGSVLSESELFEVPGMPTKFRVKKLMMPATFKKHPNLNDFRMKVEMAESEADGLIVNSFEELGHGSVELYQKAINQKIWCVGPVSLCNRVLLDRIDRGKKASDEVDRCMEWLDTMETKSMVYACLGSLCRLVPKQLIELGKGMKEFGRHMEEQTPLLSCIISDRTFFWTLELSKKFGIPRFLFNGMGCFARLAIHNVEQYFLPILFHYITTLLNVARFSPTVARNRDLGLPVHLVEIPFPWKEVGLPEGCENLDALPSPDLLRNFHCALKKMKEAIERHMEEQTPLLSCIISDRTFFWTLELSRKFGIPRCLFNGMGCFARLAIHNVEQYFLPILFHYITTLLNVARFSSAVARNRDLGLLVHLVEIPFPWKEVGLPEGCENLDALPSPDLLRNFHCALEKMKEAIERHMEEQTPLLSCIISDRTFFWTLELSRKFGIPRCLFNGMGCFARLAIHNVERYFLPILFHYIMMKVYALFGWESGSL